MDRFQIAATGVSLGASGLLLALGMGVVVDARARDHDVRERMAREERAFSLRNEERTREERALAPVVVAPSAPRETATDRWIRAAEIILADASEAPAETVVAEPAAPLADTAALAPIKEAVLTGDLAKIREAVAVHNVRSGAEPVFLHDDPELAKRGIAIRARYRQHARVFSVVLEASAPETTEPLTVLVAPGAIVKSADPGRQDTAPIQASFIHVGPTEPQARAQATICCAMIHAQDPTARPTLGLTTHHDPRVALVAATAEREHAAWGAAQVAMWAVANDATVMDVERAPGAYTCYIDPAREVLEKAGIDTNKLPLYADAMPRARRDSIDLDLLGRLRRG